MSYVFACSINTGISSLSSCADPERLPELPPGEEQRLQRAAFNLQQKLVLREWLKENHLEQYYTRYDKKTHIRGTLLTNLSSVRGLF